MFEFFRKHNKIVMGFLFVLIIPSFVLFGVDRYQGDAKGAKVAVVDGTNITRPEWDAAHRNEVDRIRQQSPNIDAATLDSDFARYVTLERMVRERVLAAASQKAGMTVSEQRLARLFSEDTGLAAFRTKDGKFDRERFQLSTGRTPEQYEAAVRADLSTQQVLLGVSGTSFAPPGLASVALNAFYDRRDIQVARFDTQQYLGKVDVNEAELEAWYKDHTSQFQQPEQATVEYVVLDQAAATQNVVMNEAELKGYYEQNRGNFGSKEERRASHILIASPASAPAAEREKAKAKATDLLEQVRKAPTSFAEVARKNSQDPGSAEKGGDLDFVTRGAMVKPFEDALFGLKKGEISGLVDTEFGYHIIQLTDIKPAVVPPFETVRPAIEKEFRSQQAAQEFAKAAETLSDLIYQQPDSLKPAADKLKLTIQTAQGVGRLPAPDAKGALASRNFLNALFAAESLDRKHNTEAIEIGPNQLAAGRVVVRTPERVVPFAEVKAKVLERVKAERATALAKADGMAKLAAWQANSQAATVGASITVSRLEPQGQPTAVIDAALRADAAKLPSWVGVDLAGDGYALVKVRADVPRAPPAAGAATQEAAQFSQAIAAAENLAYYELLKERFKASITVPRPSALALTGAR